MIWMTEHTYNDDVKEMLYNMELPFHDAVEIDGIEGDEVIDESNAYGIYGKVGPFSFYKSYWLQERVFNKHKLIYVTDGEIGVYSPGNKLLLPGDIKLSEEDEEKIAAFILTNGDYKVSSNEIIMRPNIVSQGDEDPIKLQDIKEWFNYRVSRNKDEIVYPAIPIKSFITGKKSYRGVITKIDGDAYVIGSWFNYRREEIAIGITGEYVVINDRRIKAKFLIISLDDDTVKVVNLPDGLSVEELARKYAWSYKNRENYVEELGDIIYANFSFLKPDWKLFVGHWSLPKI